MKKEVNIVLHKGNNKPRNEPKGYRVFTHSSILLKLNESILLSRIDNQRITCTVNNQHGGFHKGLGCTMSSYIIRESINFAIEIINVLSRCTECI